MNKSFTLFLILFSFFISAPKANAQLKDLLRKVEQKVSESAADKAAEKIVEKIFGGGTITDSTGAVITESVDSTGSSRNNSILGGLFGSEPVDKTYQFDLSLHMTITTSDKKGEDGVLNTIAHYPVNGAYVGMETESVFNIMDFEDMKSYAVMGGKVTVINLESAIEKAQKMSDNKADEDPEDFELKKTGRKEVIAGFECDEYMVENDEVKGFYWITQEIGISPEAIARAFSTNPAVTLPEHVQGIMLKMDMTQKDDGSKVVMVTEKVTKDKISYDLSKYEASDLSKFKF